MDITKLKELVELNLSQREIASHLKTSHTTIRYWLKKYNLTTHSNSKSTKKCPCCEEILQLNEFYSRRNKEGNSPYCRKCSINQTIKRQREIKEQAIQYKGGKCNICNYNKYQGALEFHHLDPSKKDFSIGKSKNTTFYKIKEELDKCVLLCANCHREVHAGLIELAPLSGIEPLI